jgi:hypothetical protein
MVFLRSPADELAHAQSGCGSCRRSSRSDSCQRRLVLFAVAASERENRADARSERRGDFVSDSVRVENRGGREPIVLDYRKN